MRQEAFRGLAGVRIAEPKTEACRESIPIQFLVSIGNVIGRDVFVEKATPNRDGVTRSPLKITSSGERAQVVDNQAFSTNETGRTVLLLQKGCKTLADAKKDAEKAQRERVRNSHNKMTEKRINFSGNTLSNETVNLDKVGRLHELSIIADQDTFNATLRRIEFEEGAHEASRIRKWKFTGSNCEAKFLN
jgi:hypothetical protein